MQKVMFFGSSPFSTIVLQKLIDSKIDISSVVTKPDKPVGRHLKLTANPVKEWTLKNGLTVYEGLENLPVAPGDVGLVAAYGKIIPQSLIDKFAGKIYNIHPSLLPKYRGPSPLQQQILDSVTETGVTIIQLDAQMDHGPIVAVAKDTIKTDDNSQSLGERLFNLGTDLFINEVLNKKPQAIKQDHLQATYTKLLTRQDGFVPWEEFTKNGPELKQKFRAYFPWPGVWTLGPDGQRRKM